MDDRHIRAALDQIARQEIPDDMNLWENLKQEAPIHRAARFTRSISLIVVLLLMLVAAAAVYAVVRVQIVDPGISGAMDANLVTELGMSQTIGDVTVTLDWAYADANRIAIGYSVAVPPDYQGAVVEGRFVLTDADQSFYSDGGGSGGGLMTPEGSEYVTTFGVAFVENPPEMLDMHFELTLSAEPVQQPTEEATGRSGGGGGFGYGSGGGGGSDATPEPGIAIDFGIDPVYVLGVFNFDFDLPYIPAIHVPVDQTAEANGLSFSVGNMVVTPSATQLELCFDLPTPEDWTPWAVLITGGVEISQTSWEIVSTDDDTRCGILTFYAPYQQEPITFTLTIDELVSPYAYTEETIAEFERMLAAQGIEIEILTDGERNFNFNLGTVPDGIDVGAALNEAYRIFARYTAGPWVFTIDVP